MRFSLKTLFFVLTVAACAAALLAKLLPGERHLTETERCIKILEAGGARVERRNGRLFLHLENANLGPRQVAALQKIPEHMTVNLSRTWVTSQLMGKLSNAQVEELDLASSHLTDGALKQIGKLSYYLVTLTLRDTHIPENGLRHLQGCDQLQYLDLTEATVDEESFRSLGGPESLVRLENLHMGGAILPNSVWNGVTEMPYVAQLTMPYSNVPKNALVLLKKNTRLTELDMTGCQFTMSEIEEITASLSECCQLSRLTLDETVCDDASVANLVRIEGLKHLSLRDTRITDECFTSVGKMPNLLSLDVEDTAVTPEGLRRYLLQRNPNLETVYTTVSLDQLQDILKTNPFLVSKPTRGTIILRD